MDNKKINFNSLKNQPSDDGKFGEYGGMFVAETLMPLILSLSKNYNKLKKSNAKYIDVSSGVESSPGVKSKVLIKKLIQKIKKLNSK